MVQIKSDPQDASAETIKLHIADADLSFNQAAALAKTKAKERCADPMLLSWCDRKNDRYYPRFECGTGDKPAWIVFAEARGGNLTIDINAGEFIFIYLKL